MKIFYQLLTGVHLVTSSSVERSRNLNGKIQDSKIFKSGFWFSYGRTLLFRGFWSLVNFNFLGSLMLFYKLKPTFIPDSLIDYVSFQQLLLYWGLCVPAECDSRSITQILDNLIEGWFSRCWILNVFTSWEDRCRWRDGMQTWQISCPSHDLKC